MKSLRHTTRATRFSGLLLMVAATTPVIRAEPVCETEALQAANHRMTTALQAKHATLARRERSTRLGALSRRTIQYVDVHGGLVDKPGGGALAYAVTYDLGGFVLVSADDRMEPVLAFDADTSLRGTDRGQSIIRSFLSRQVLGRRGRVQAAAAHGESESLHPHWQKLRRTFASGQLAERNSPESCIDSGGDYMATPHWGQNWYYNDEVVRNNDNTEVPTRCLATAMAILFRYHQWPPSGTGTHTNGI